MNLRRAALFIAATFLAVPVVASATAAIVYGPEYVVRCSSCGSGLGIAGSVWVEAFWEAAGDL